jgi:hypothetical protein
MALALLWVPATSHCMLEEISGFQFLKCAADTGGESDCEDDACGKVETPTYKVSETRVSVSKPITAELPFEVPIALTVVAKKPQPTTAAPPEILNRWQFISRAALPPRAPSLDS